MLPIRSDGDLEDALERRENRLSCYYLMMKNYKCRKKNLREDREAKKKKKKSRIKSLLSNTLMSFIPTRE